MKKTNKKEQILELYEVKERKRKYSYQEIATIVGVTKQYVQQVVSKYLTKDK